jgi:hypothetical protein
MWLKVPVEERDEKGKKRLTGGKDNDRGTPQGGVMTAGLATDAAAGISIRSIVGGKAGTGL